MKLKVFNTGYRNGIDHLNVCARSRLAAARMIVEWEGYPGNNALSIGQWERELRDYASACWGKDMKGINPEEGIWLVKNKYSEGASTERVWPKPG